jgi:hypothetical protein
MTFPTPETDGWMRKWLKPIGTATGTYLVLTLLERAHPALMYFACAAIITYGVWALNRPDHPPKEDKPHV